MLDKLFQMALDDYLAAIGELVEAIRSKSPREQELRYKVERCRLVVYRFSCLTEVVAHG